MGKKTIKRKRTSPRNPSEASKKVREISQEKLKQILTQTRQFLTEDDAEILEDAIDTLAVVTSELEMKGASVARLRRLLFGASTEKMSNVFPDKKGKPSGSTADGHNAGRDEGMTKTLTTRPIPKRKRNPKAMAAMVPTRTPAQKSKLTITSV
jgi:hypothetical protein